jgi:hypothetical protein
MIEDAQPKQGLETGSLEGASGLSPRARVALNYEDDLAGKNGPTARFDTFRELIGTEISAALNQMRFTAGDGTQIFGREGSFAVNSPTKSRGGSAPQEGVNPFPARWDLAVVNSVTGTIRLARVGTIIKDAVDITTGIAITDGTGVFAPGDGDTLRLKIKGTFASPTVTLECDGEWTGYPSAVEKTGTGTSAAFVALYYPLWKFSGSVISDGEALFEGLYAKKLVGDYDFLRTLSAYYDSGSPADIPFSIPTLMPYHSVL